MVHSKLISEGKVAPLTYSQLRRIEKIDAKKARDTALIEAGKTTITAGGSAAEGFFAGAGLALQGFFSGDAIAFGAKAAAAALFLQWLNAHYPDFSRFFHLDTLGFGPNASPPPPGVQPPPGVTGTGPSPGLHPQQWEIGFRYVGAFSGGGIDQYQYYPTQEQAQTAADYYALHTAGNFIVFEEPKQVS